MPEGSFRLTRLLKAEPQAEMGTVVSPLFPLKSFCLWATLTKLLCYGMPCNLTLFQPFVVAADFKAESNCPCRNDSAERGPANEHNLVNMF